MARASLSRTGDFGVAQQRAIAPPANNTGGLLSRYSTHLGDTLLRHRAELAERASRIDAELANKVKADFIANISHELRTPLNSILGFSKMLKDTETAPLAPNQVAEYAGFILGSATNLLTVVNDVILMSKLQSNKFDIAVDKLDAEEVLRSCITAADEKSRETGIKFIHKIDDGLPSIYANGQHLGPSVGRLIDNAFQFTPEGGSVVLTARKASDQKVLIGVSDTGCGMSREEVAVALTEFGQANNRLDRDNEGVGLGLPIVKALTERQDAEFIIRSEKGKGTHVLLLFPIVEIQTASQECGG